MQNKEVTNKQIVTALILGDGNLEWLTKSGHYGILIHSASIYSDYHEYKRNLLCEC